MVEDAERRRAMIGGAKVSAAMRSAWEEDGWLLVPRFLELAQIRALSAEANRLAGEPQLFATRGTVPNSAQRSDRLDPVIDLSPAFAALARDPLLVGLVSEVLDGAAQLMKDKFIAKPPGAGGYATHQDAAYWPGLGIEYSRFLTAILFLDDAEVAKGAIECASGHHRGLLTDPDTVADPDEAALGAFTTIEAQAGDLLLLHAMTPHRSGPNRAMASRRTLLFTYGVDRRPDLYAIYKKFQQGLRS
ncbi:phytanoyl-CoA dioxygenase family protein [Sphingomonas xanthus]|uniref:Phytanoyl-CoA dioxygenase family protein n=1 Tax=Sphingomonas xanthus TaxID=2594473 RepID=A0A516IQM1_9SPHN|nr:phytanoyl-CoA dioxygenase family protein [Sphingomonas xanthus]QDP19211.1 phytanoyl-CoA dioxygenase family protein [Sphingomonas xanthus]